MRLVQGPPHGPGPWTTSSSFPLTTPNFQKEIAHVNMKIYRRSGYEKHRLVFIVRKQSLESTRADWLKNVFV